MCINFQTMLTILRKFESYFGFQQPLVWKNIIGLIILHIASLYTLLYLIPIRRVTFMHYVISFVYTMGSAIGVTVGAHRLWTHKTFKAKLPLRIFLMMLYSSAGLYSLVQWARDHRTHHKYADTDADPHNARRGFFFSHCGWLMMKRHPDVKSKGKFIDVSDLLEDPVVRFHQKYFVPLFIIFFILVPLWYGCILLGENFFVMFCGHILFRYTCNLHLIWFVNSVAHLWGTRPYNKNIMAVQNKTFAFFTLGEAWHNFHHVFPWDYRIGEHGESFQTGTKFIDLFARWGWAYDLKFASPEMIQRVLAKNGNLKINEEMPYEEINANIIKNKKEM